MKRFALILAVLVVGMPVSAQLIISEIDYNDVSTDNLEIVEIQNLSGSAVDLNNASADISLLHCNGSNGTVAFTEDLTGTISAAGASGFYRVKASSNLTDVAEQVGAFSSIQNGAPDGMALISTAGGVDTLLDSISWDHAAVSNDYSCTTANSLVINFNFGTNTSSFADTATDTDSFQRLTGTTANTGSQWGVAPRNPLPVELMSFSIE